MPLLPPRPATKTSVLKVFCLLCLALLRKGVVGAGHHHCSGLAPPPTHITSEGSARLSHYSLMLACCATQVHEGIEGGMHFLRYDVGQVPNADQGVGFA